MTLQSVVVLLGLLLLAGCSKPQPWPVPELTLPPGSTPAPIPDLFLEGDLEKLSPEDKHYITPMAQYRAWAKGFNNALPWSDVADHLWGILGPKGYTPAMKKYQHVLPDIPGGEREDYVRVWESPEGRFIV